MKDEEYLKGVTCIIADDSPSQRDRNTAVALKYGMTVLAVVNTGNDAIRAAIQYKPIVCLLDIIMKDTTGIEAALAIRKAGVQTKIILVTSTAQKAVTSVELTTADGILVKPFPDQWYLQKVYSIVYPQKAEAPEMKDDA
jgi:CheY-like chemotaxis protein